MDRQSQAQSGFFHRRGAQLAAASLRPIGLRENRRDAMARVHDALECGNREHWGAQKNQDHSPAFTNLRTLRRIKSRFRALTWLIYKRPFRWSISWQKARAKSSSPVVSKGSPLTF